MNKGKIAVVVSYIISMGCFFMGGVSYAKSKAVPDTITINNTDTTYIALHKSNAPSELLLSDPQLNLYEVLEFYHVKYPDIAYAIAVEETGWFKSKLCTQNHNLFGLYDSKHKRYYKFNNWFESVIAYRDLVESKYSSEEGYYQFLRGLPYSSNDDYIKNIKKIVNLIRSED